MCPCSSPCAFSPPAALVTVPEYHSFLCCLSLPTHFYQVCPGSGPFSPVLSSFWTASDFILNALINSRLVLNSQTVHLLPPGVYLHASPGACWPRCILYRCTPIQCRAWCSMPVSCFDSKTLAAFCTLKSHMLKSRFICRGCVIVILDKLGITISFIYLFIC